MVDIAVGSCTWGQAATWWGARMRGRHAVLVRPVGCGRVDGTGELYACDAHEHLCRSCRRRVLSLLLAATADNALV